MIARSQLDSLFNGEGLRFLGEIELAKDQLNYGRFKSWLANNSHAGMKYLENNLSFRENPQTLESGMDAALIFALKYDELKRTAAAKGPKIAGYALMRDYHKVMRRRGEAVGAVLQNLAPGLQFRVTVDSAPLLERSLAAKTLTGWIGKNSCFIQPDHGSFMLLGEILINRRVLSEDKAKPPSSTRSPIDVSYRSEQGGCGSCRRCQVFCPTGALDKDFVLDANLCLSYWTIEHRGPIPVKFWPYLKSYWFGCDICQDVCPYNRKVPKLDQRLPRRDELLSLDLIAVAQMDQAVYIATFGGTPLTRAKKAGLQRNALIAAIVTEAPGLNKLLADIQDRKDHYPELVHETIAQVDEYHHTLGN